MEQVFIFPLHHFHYLKKAVASLSLSLNKKSCCRKLSFGLNSYKFPSIQGYMNSFHFLSFWEPNIFFFVFFELFKFLFLKIGSFQNLFKIWTFWSHRPDWFGKTNTITLSGWHDSVIWPCVADKIVTPLCGVSVLFCHVRRASIIKRFRFWK